MRLLRRRDQTENDGTHALVDVVFLLLVFFMVTATFTALELDLPGQLAAGSSVAAERDPDLDRIRIHVQRSGGYQLGSEVCADLTVLRERLRQLRQVADAPVIVDGDGELPFGRIVGALDAARAAGFARVALAGGP